MKYINETPTVYVLFLYVSDSDAGGYSLTTYASTEKLLQGIRTLIPEIDWEQLSIPYTINQLQAHKTIFNITSNRQRLFITKITTPSNLFALKIESIKKYVETYFQNSETYN